MAYRDLREFIKKLEAEGELVRIQTEVDSDLEITEITDRVSKDYGPALLFENVKGSNYPVLINAFGTYKRMAWALGVEKLDDVARDMERFLDVPGGGWIEKFKKLPLLFEATRFFPKKVRNAPCQEVVEKDVDLGKIPILKCWPEDGGKYVTLPLVFSKDPETNIQNLGMYRLQVFDKKTTGMHWHIHKDGARIFHKHKKLGKKMEMAVAIGADPATIYASTAPLPPGIDEILFAGFLRKSPVEMVMCKTVDLMVPAHAEFVLEGYVDPEEDFHIEGPFGDHTGYYSLADYYPVFHITCITRKTNPVYNATVVGQPPQEDCYLAKATERIFLPLMKMIIPEIIDMNLPLEGVFHNCVIVSIKKEYPGAARKVMHSLWGLGQMSNAKMIIVVDQDVDVQNLSEVTWRVTNNIDAKRDLIVTEGPLDVLDHSSPLPNYGAKLGIDATKKWPSEGHSREWPEDVVMKEEIKERVTRRWEEYGLAYLQKKD
ncbi:MAG: menaquinone biosynthesis decarboxylase [Halanaerobiales bacterium]|nr:menaquinone biosynthesis decarboxylase [Halanaerobiales bacterium]